MESDCKKIGWNHVMVAGTDGVVREGWREDIYTDP